MSNKGVQLAFDIISAVLVLFIYSGALLLALALGQWTGADLFIKSIAWKPLGTVLGIAFYSVLWILILPLFIFVIRILLPRLKEGTHDIPGPMVLAWGLHLVLGRVIWLIPIGYLVNLFAVLRFIYFRALGCHNAFGVNTSLSISITDFPLVTIEEGAFIGDKVTISGHMMEKGKLILQRVHIGKSCLVHAFTLLGPGTHMEEGSTVGPRCLTHQCYLEAEAEVRGYSMAIKVRIPRGQNYLYLPDNPDEHKHPDFEEYRHGGEPAP